jgi:drug/metabolite transporter (DMT)-like permease
MSESRALPPPVSRGAAPPATGASASARRLGALALITVVVAWGLTWPVSKALLAELSPLWLLVLRTGIAGATMFGIALARGRLALPPRGDLPVVVSIAGLHMVGFAVLAFWGLALVPAGRSVVLAYTTPLWVVPGAALFLREPLTGRRAAGVAIGLLGLVALCNPGALDWTDRGAVLGHLSILGAAGLWAMSILHIRAHRWRATPLALVPWEMLLATAVLAAAALLGGPPPHVQWSVRLVALLLYAAIPGTALAYWASATASQNLPAVTTSLGLLATPVVGVVVSALWLGEALTPSLLAAVALILGGVALGTLGARRASPER